MKTSANKKQIEELLDRGVSEIINRAHLEKALFSGKKLRVKYGADPTQPDLHLGHAVAMKKLKILQDLNHHVIFIIGDFTVRIGDPSGALKTRPMLLEKEIEKNSKTYFNQVGKILDTSKIEIRKNSEWFSKMNLAEFIKLASKFTVARTLERDDFQKRLKNGVNIGIHELFYPIMQAYDSVVLNIDLEIAGSDQKFNVHAGRELQKKLGKPEQDILLAPLLIGLDGKQKMSKSLNNYIGITENSDSQYGKIMSISDKLLERYFELLTDLSFDKKENPRDVKMRLAYEIVKTYHSKKEAEKAQENFIKLFQKKEMPKQMTKMKLANKNIIEVLVLAKLARSKGEARRLIEERGIKIDGKIIDSNKKLVKGGSIIQKGKRYFVKII